MFRLTTSRMANWAMATNTLKTSSVVQVATKDMAKKQKKDKPNPCQPSKKKEAKPEKPSTFVADNTPKG